MHLKTARQPALKRTKKSPHATHTTKRHIRSTTKKTFCPTTAPAQTTAPKKRHFSSINVTSANDFRTPHGISKTSLMFTVGNRPGALTSTLEIFSECGVNLTRIESRPCRKSSDYEFVVDFDTIDEAKSVELMATLRKHTNQLNVLQSTSVPWFPRSRKDLDQCASQILDAGVELQADHPGFHDPVYRQRRNELALIADRYKYGDKIPTIEYTKAETDLWNSVYHTLKDELWLKYGSSSFTRLLPLLEQNCGFDKHPPQLQHVNDYLSTVTGFNLRPVSGLVSSRSFINALATRTFFSTNYLRHPSSPTYTPEPDLIHEVGHIIMLADNDFADFSQQIGLLSLGCTDEQLDQLGKLYWFTVEFGLIKEGNDLKALGAGVFSSIDEMKHAMGILPGKKANYIPFEPEIVSKTEYPITTLQPTYVVAESLDELKTKLLDYAQTLKKPFHVQYLPNTMTIDVDSNIVMEQTDFKAPHESPYANESFKATI